MGIVMEIPLDGEQTGTCPVCGQTVQVKLIAVHVSADYGTPSLTRVNLQGTHTHNCPGAPS